jgi:Spy/CpxP family protein refolding chaperone
VGASGGALGTGASYFAEHPDTFQNNDHVEEIPMNRAHASGPKRILASLAAVLLLVVPAAAQSPPPPPAAPQASPPAMGQVGILPVPGIGDILDRRQELGLSTAQVARLEQLGLEVAREGIRRQADLMIAQMDLAALLHADPSQAIDLAKVEAKLREIERIRTDLGLALVRAVEAAKAELTPEQRAKLATLMADVTSALDPPPIEEGASAPSGSRGESNPVILARATGHAPPGGGGRPSGPSHGPAPHPGAGPRPGPGHPGPTPPHFGSGSHFAPHRDFHRGSHVGVFVGPSLWWDPFWWTYSPPPAFAPPPPVYDVPPPQTFWYYCQSLGAYYPYTPSCPEPWVVVPIS